jgi:hypothetical protein
VFLLLQAHADGKDLKTENLGQSFLYKTWNFETVLKHGVTCNIKIWSDFKIIFASSFKQHTLTFCVPIQRQSCLHPINMFLLSLVLKASKHCPYIVFYSFVVFINSASLLILSDLHALWNRLL